MKKIRCKTCKQPLKPEEIKKFKDQCESCLSHEIQKMRLEQKRDLNHSPH